VKLWITENVWAGQGRAEHPISATSRTPEAAIAPAAVQRSEPKIAVLSRVEFVMADSPLAEPPILIRWLAVSIVFLPGVANVNLILDNGLSN
jgi:hypothetical protein